MNIKKIVKLSFFLIAILVILIATINSIVLYQIKDNDYYKKNIAKLISLQENMNSLSKDLVISKNPDDLYHIKSNFLKYEKEFEKTKKIFTSNKNDNFIDRFVEDIYRAPIIRKDLQLLYSNEKNIEAAFDKAHDLQKKKIELKKKFDLAYPLENKLRKKIGSSVSSSGNIVLVHTFGGIEYYSKEALFQKKDKETLQKWLNKIYFLKNKNIRGINEYIGVVQRVGSYAIDINKFEKLQEKLTTSIIEIINLNRKVDVNIENNIEKLSSSFIDKTYLYVLILLGCTIFIIVLVAYLVSKNVDLSVDEIEEKVENGLEEIKALNHEIEVTQKEVVFTMGAIGEQRSKETGNHVKRVAEYTKLLALNYGLEESEAEMLKQASPMHDIGKIAIPDSVLNKPGRFNEEERKIMDTHAKLGYDMLKGSNRALLKMASIVAYEHHEKWDGSGYPQKKAGEDIHIYGRITAVADVFDALGSDRVYKKAWEDEKIFKFFKEERGVHFDPTLIDIFFENLDSFLAIRDKFKD
ncbi:HD-GYP domain-containing protein [Sulfurospirillum arcachonense]|uniref:HD-GYP domain-containing protein n=1 Tax=Sulfurospirillum arcachonense TaxID=57666 RepID=UPI000468F52C|nr:HD domain-containing phosphohydrolase [Sulfurospirillum arcachonense]